MGVAPDLDAIVVHRGLFHGTTVEMVNFGLALWRDVVLSMQAHALTGPVAAVLVNLGAARALLVLEDCAWLFDSHGRGGSGAYAEFFDSPSMMAGVLESDATAAGGVASETQLAVFRPPST